MPDRAKIVREIFKLSIAGFGAYTIAKQLNAKKVPTFGPAPKWDQSSIHNLLRNRATVGEYQPGKYRDKIPTNEIPVPNYYPPVIEESLFRAAQEARVKNLASGRGRKGRLITNLFAGLTTCAYCDSPVKLHRNGQGNSLICKMALESHGCHRFRWSLDDFEHSFFECFEQSGIEQQVPVLLAEIRTAREAESERQIYGARAEMLRLLRATISKVMISSAGVTPPATKPYEDIRRDHPKRTFTVEFLDGSSRTGSSASFKQRTARKFNSAVLSESLLLTPRQGALAALLADGEPLSNAAEKLGMGLTTARWHLREIFKRTDTHSQSELVNLVERKCPPA
jgi:DNA-binding CsgD family transcriptional regulator